MNSSTIKTVIAIVLGAILIKESDKASNIYDQLKENIKSVYRHKILKGHKE